jgi:hypothetical protein
MSKTQMDGVFVLVPTGEVEFGGGDVERSQGTELDCLDLDVPAAAV